MNGSRRHETERQRDVRTETDVVRFELSNSEIS
jgi:hypothetical protein